MTTFVDSVEFVTHHCGQCGVLFAMTRDYHDKRKEDHKTWYCPNGHGRMFNGPSETALLRKEVERKQQMLEAESARAARMEAERDQAAKAHSRMRSRVMNGVCPCCNRTFQNLMQHMQTEHAGKLSLRTLRQAFGMTQSDIAREVGVSAPYVSNFENGRPVPANAMQSLERWMEEQGAKS